MATSNHRKEEKQAFTMPAQKLCSTPYPSPPASCYDNKQLVTILVDVDKERFRLPKGLLTWYSTYFKAALEGNSKECQTKTFNMPYEDVDVFKAFSSWISTRKLYDKDQVEMDGAGSSRNYPLPSLACDIWIFADKRGIPALKNDDIDLLHESLSVRHAYLDCCITDIYVNTVASSPLRQYVIDKYYGRVKYESFKQISSEFLVVDFVRDMLDQAQGGNKRWCSYTQATWAAIDMCQYHDHSAPTRKRKLAELEADKTT